jgi:hypothetical protein
MPSVTVWLLGLPLTVLVAVAVLPVLLVPK